MSQKERKSPNARYWAVVEIERLRAEDGLSISEACEAMAVSRTSYRRWRDSLAENPEYQQEKRIEVGSSRPKRNARQVTDSTRQRVIDAAMDLGQSSANSIAHHLKASGITIGAAKVIEILEEEGLYGEIQVKNAKGEYKRKKGLLRLYEKRQKRP